MAHLNNYLESFRQEVNRRYPKRKKTSDGTLGDQAHKARVSEHNPDSDGTIDAFDMDVNLFGSDNDTGSAAEDAEVRKLIKEFLSKPEAQLVIYDRHIYNPDIQGGKARWYGDWSSGKNPHDHHVHFQARQSKEDRQYNGDKVKDAQPTPAPTKVKASELKLGDQGSDVKVLQRALGRLEVDGKFGKVTESRLKAYQRGHGLKDDGIAGPLTLKSLKLK